jgi:hypothetical protein
MSPAARGLLCAALVVLAPSCRERAKEGSGGGATAAPSTGATGRIVPGVARLLVADSAGIRHYLETVDTARGATFDVRWSPNTVRLDRAETLRSLRRVSRSGATFTFSADEPKVRGLKPGQILLVWGIALRKVTAVEPRGGRVIVRTDVASIPEAIQNGKIGWKTRTSFAHGVVSPSAPEPGAAKRKVSGRAGSGGLFRYAGYRTELPASVRQDGDTEVEDEELPNHTEGELAGYEFEVGYAYAGNRLDFQLEARKADEGAFSEPEEKQGERARAHGPQETKGEQTKKEKEEQEQNTRQGVGEIENPAGVLTPKGLFGLAAEVFDLRLRVRGHLDEFDTDGSMTIADALLGNFHVNVNNLKGEADLDWIARLGEKGVFSENIKVEVPFNYDIPLIIGGLPFVIEVGVNFLAAPGLTSHFASAAGSYHLTFEGGAGITATGTDVKTESSLTGTSETGDKQVTSLGVSAVLVAVQLPRIGFGLGLINTSAVAYVDHVIATSVVTAGGTSLIPCRRYQINSSFGAGVGVQLLGIKIPGLGSKKTLGVPFDKVITEPPNVNCQV